MADTQELFSPLKPGRDNTPRYDEPMRKAVTEELGKLGENAPNVTPQGELADEVIENANANFSKVVGVDQTSDQTVGSQNVGSSDGFDNFKEIFKAFTPGEETERTDPAKEGFDLVTARKEKKTEEIT